MIEYLKDHANDAENMRNYEIENHVVSLDLSKKLNELGVINPSLFYWIKLCKDKEEYEIDPATINGGPMGCCWNHYSAYIATELLEILPRNVLEGGREYYLKIAPAINQECIEWKVSYIHGGFDFLKFFYEEYLQNSLAKMIIYLMENKLMEIPK